eukprot:IDg2246t1
MINLRIFSLTNNVYTVFPFGYSSKREQLVRTLYFPPNLRVAHNATPNNRLSDSLYDSTQLFQAVKGIFSMFDSSDSALCQYSVHNSFADAIVRVRRYHQLTSNISQNASWPCNCSP